MTITIDKSMPWRHKLIFFKDRKKKWRFKFAHRNGHIIAASTESYCSFTYAKRSAERLIDSITAGQCITEKV